MAKSDLPLTKIIGELDGSDASVKEKVLETLVLGLIDLIGLHFVEWRLRPQQTKGVEVDALAESSHLVFHRWQIQCKDTAIVTMEDIAIEVGLTFYLKSNVIMMVTTGKFSNAAFDYVKAIKQTTNLRLILIDNKDLHVLSSQPTAISTILSRETKYVQ